MVLHPEVQAKAEAEIDATLGPAILPITPNRDRLPYVNSMMFTEDMRSRKSRFCTFPIIFDCILLMACLALVIFGVLIPPPNMGYKPILTVTRAIGGDETTYEDPETFNPDGFEDHNVPQALVFGWGRRKCPGIHYADCSLFIDIASLLAAFNFSKIEENEVPRIEDAANSVVTELKPFDFEFSSPSEKHRQIILDSLH
ncbi:cytochrome P450 [Rhizoctonia solani]|nr:cytochrome P450 [Rhizoctonia solani]